MVLYGEIIPQTRFKEIKIAIELKSTAVKEVSIIIPALNEEETIGRVIDEIINEDIGRGGYRVDVTVVDNNSTDRTREIAEGKNVKVIVEPVRGKARAVNKAFQAIDSDFVFIIDADYTYPATFIPAMLRMLEGDYDVVLGSRLNGHIEKGAMTRFNLFGNRILALLASALFNTKISDLCTGCWGFKRTALKNLRVDATGFDLEANLFIEIVRKGYLLGEVPINYRRRATPPKLHGIRDGFKIIKILFVKRFNSMFKYK
jgi:dolichol-phosphate mannosyltransferase